MNTPDGSESNTDRAVRLPGIDDAVDDLIANAERIWDGDPERAKLVHRAVADDDRIRYGVARRLQQEYATIRAIKQERERIWDAYGEAIAPHVARARFLEDVLEQMALMWRDSGRGNVMMVPGVGEWRTRRNPGGWQIDTVALLRTLGSDERGQFVVREEPKPPAEKLDRRTFVEHLDELVSTALAGRERVTPEDMSAAAAAVAQTYGEAVRWVPGRITVTPRLAGEDVAGDDGD